MVRLMRHCQTKETETDRPNLNYYANSLPYLILYKILLAITTNIVYNLAILSENSFILDYFSNYGTTLNSEKTLNGLLVDIENLLSKMIRAANLEPQLNIREEAILRFLGKKQVISINEIKTTFNMDSDKVSRILKSLENYREGTNKTPLIERNINPHDKRHRTISLTLHGKETLEKESNRRAQRLGLLLNKLSENEQVTFARLIKKMAQD